MGALIIPTSGNVFVDTQVVIYTVEANQPYWPLLQPLWQASRSGRLTIIGSELMIMETLVVPLRNNDATLVAAYDQLFLTNEIRLLPIDRFVLLQAAHLRATIPGLRTPDALHAAPARLSPCTMFLTNDRGFRRVPGLPLAVLDDILAAP